eukprot:scaffold667613_cov57-Prasinocladus_malaysianus.AAC.1
MAASDCAGGTVEDVLLEGDDAIPDQCLACHKQPPEYQANPCRCKILCRQCAMKVATGGKCKKC